MSPQKEPGFFAPPNRFQRTIHDRETYLQLFADSAGERYLGEASPSYLWAESAPEAISRVSPGASIIASLRDPVELSHALYMSVVRWGLERRSFQEAIGDELDGKTYPDRPAYVRIDPFAAPLSRYLETFERRVLVLFLDELADDTRATVRLLYEFLEIDPAVAGRIDLSPENRFTLSRHRPVRRLLASQRARAIARTVVPAPLRRPIQDVLAPPKRKPEPEPATVEILRRLYRPEVSALEELLGRPLPDSWRHRYLDAPAASAVRG